MIAVKTKRDIIKQAEACLLGSPETFYSGMAMATPDNSL